MRTCRARRRSSLQDYSKLHRVTWGGCRWCSRLCRLTRVRIACVALRVMRRANNRRTVQTSSCAGGRNRPRAVTRIISHPSAKSHNAAGEARTHTRSVVPNPGGQMNGADEKKLPCPVPAIRLLRIERFRGIEKLEWRPGLQHRSRRIGWAAHAIGWWCTSTTKTTWKASTPSSPKVAASSVASAWCADAKPSCREHYQ